MAGRPKVLVVDDEKTLRDIVSRALEKSGCECVQAANGEEALERASEQAFDLVVTDLKMPKMDGLALIEWLQKKLPEVPVIIMTGHADVESARKALRMRVSDYLLKPFESLAEVQAAAKRALESRLAQRPTESLVREFEARAQEFTRREQHLTQTLECAKLEIDSLAERLQRAQAVTARSAEQIEEMIANLQNGILVTDLSGTVISFNAELRRQLQALGSWGPGLSADRLPGDAALRKAILESHERLRLGVDEPVLAETTDVSGEPRMYEVRSAHLSSGEDAVGILTTVRPVRRAPAGPSPAPQPQARRAAFEDERPQGAAGVLRAPEPPSGPA